MSEAYFNVKRKLEELGYNMTLPLDAVPLVECMLADLLQTTRSLQQYMDLSKEALMQRDALMLEAEPYRCDNAKLINENNQLHSELMELKEINERLSKESKRKLKSLSEELVKKDVLISKLQHDVRDLSLRGLCADTHSSRIKSRRKDAGDCAHNKVCTCNEKATLNYEQVITGLNQKISYLEEMHNANQDEIVLLRNKIEHRDNEIVRLNILLEGGRPIAALAAECCKKPTDAKVQELMKQLQEISIDNDLLKKENKSGLEKQHEAMLRALSLADKNKKLQDELQKVETLALKVEEDCNKRLAAMLNETNSLQTKIETLSMRNSKLENELSIHQLTPALTVQKIQEALDISIKEKESLQKEIKDLIDINKSLQENFKLFFQSGKHMLFSDNNDKEKQVCPTRFELQALLENERKNYEKQILNIHEKLTATMDLFNKRISKTKDTPKDMNVNNSCFVKDLHNKLCESEQKILMLKKENDELKNQTTKDERNNKHIYKDAVSQLNAENEQLSKENIALSQQLNQYQKLERHAEKNDNARKEMQKLMDEIDKLTHEIAILRKDKQEYNMRYREAQDLADKLKRDLAFKQKEIEQLQEENSSYKMTSRSGKASVDHLKDECNFLREQIKRMQTDVIKEKTMACQIKNIQLETERSSNEMQNELACVQKQLSLARETINSLEQKCSEYQSEISTLINDKLKLIENLKKMDLEHNKLVIELDNKTEANSILDQKLKSEQYDISKLQNEVSELKRKVSINKVSDHKLADYESQIKFLNGEISRLTQQLENALIENKHIQNNLADVNGTLRITKIEYEKSRKEVEGLKQQLQHYVAEIRRIEELLSQKEAERSDMLEQFASLSVEANILENTNHSLESESVSKSMQLQSYVSKIQDLESKLMEKENTIEAQANRISSMVCKVTSLENEIKLITEEKTILEHNVSYLKQMCNNLQCEHAESGKGMGDAKAEAKLYENRIKSLSTSKANLELEKDELKEKLRTTESLLSNARKEVVELKLALQDATSETQLLHQRVGRLNRGDAAGHEASLTNEELELPLLLEETIHEVSHEEDEESSRYHEIHKRYSKYSHGSTL